MNIDCINFGPFRITRHPNGAETVLDTRSGHASNMRTPLQEIADKAANREDIIDALHAQLMAG